MLKTITKESAKVGSPHRERAGNLEFQVSKIRGVEYLYFRIGETVAKRAGLQAGDKIAIGWDDETGFGVIKPSPKGWALQSGNLKAEDPPLVVRITRKPKDNPPYLEKLGVCQDVQAVDKGRLEFIFPDKTTFGAQRLEEDVPHLYERHREIVERDRRPTRRDEVSPEKKAGWKDGKPYGKRATDV